MPDNNFTVLAAPQLAARSPSKTQVKLLRGPISIPLIDRLYENPSLDNWLIAALIIEDDRRYFLSRRCARHSFPSTATKSRRWTLAIIGGVNDPAPIPKAS